VEIGAAQEIVSPIELCSPSSNARKKILKNDERQSLRSAKREVLVERDQEKRISELLSVNSGTTAIALCTICSKQMTGL